MEDDVDLFHVERVEVEEQVSVHEVSEAPERLELARCVQQHTRRHVRHSLHITQVGSHDGVGDEDVLEGLVEPVPVPEVAQLPVSPVQVLLDNLQVLPEKLVSVSVALAELGSLKERGVQFLRDPEGVANQVLPDQPSQLRGNAPLDRVLDLLVLVEVLRVLLDLRDDALHPPLHLFLVVRTLVHAVFENGLESFPELGWVVIGLDFVILVQIQLLLGFLRTGSTFPDNLLDVHLPSLHFLHFPPLGTAPLSYLVVVVEQVVGVVFLLLLFLLVESLSALVQLQAAQEIVVLPIFRTFLQRLVDFQFIFDLLANFHDFILLFVELGLDGGHVYLCLDQVLLKHVGVRLHHRNLFVLDLRQFLLFFLDNKDLVLEVGDGFLVLLHLGAGFLVLQLQLHVPQLDIGLHLLDLDLAFLEKGIVPGGLLNHEVLLRVRSHHEVEVLSLLLLIKDTMEWLLRT